MAWIESHQSLATHRKTLALRRILKINRAQVIGHLHLLWWWCLDNAPNGDISHIDKADIAEAMDWEGDPEELITALKTVGFLDETGQVHDWGQFAGKLMDRREDNRKRQQEHRDRLRHNDKPNSNNDVTVMSQLRNGATVPNSTVPNPTVQNHKDTSAKQVSPDALRLSELLRCEILKNNAGAKVPEKLESWAEHVDLMMRRDNRKPCDIETVILFCQRDEFWRANILSTSKLRQQYDKLWLQKDRSGGQNGGISRTNQGTNATRAKYDPQTGPGGTKYHYDSPEELRAKAIAAGQELSNV